MKRLLAIILSAITVLATSLFISGCGQTPDTFDIYMPDGAPALALSKLMVDDEKLGVDAKYHVVTSSTIRNYIVNESADIAILPVTAATKLCGNGDKYKILASVTNGNIFVIGKGTGATLADLVGKKVAVANLADFPGLVFKALLNKNTIPYTTINAEDSADTTKVNLVGITGTAVKASLDIYDYVVAPQPAATVATASTDGAEIRMDIQALWGGDMVQAVAVIKASLASNTTLINNFLTALAKTTNEWIVTNKTAAVDSINAHFVDNATSTLKAQTLNPVSVAGSNFKVVTYIDAEFATGDNALLVSLDQFKTRVNNMITSFSALNITPSPVGTVSDAFYIA